MNRTDTFIRANNPSTLGTPSDGGSAWNALAGTFGIDTNQGYASVAPGNVFAALNAAANDVVITATINVAGSSPGLLCRCIDASNFQDLVFFGGTWFLQETVAGASTNLTTVPGTVANGDVLEITAAGTAITCKKNGTTILTATSSNLLAAQNHGLYLFADTTSRFTNFAITDTTPPPPTTGRGLIPTNFTLWEYRPATGTTLSRLTFWMEPRNLLLYDAQADTALLYLQANTPAALQF